MAKGSSTYFVLGWDDEPLDGVAKWVVIWWGTNGKTARVMFNEHKTDYIEVKLIKAEQLSRRIN